MEYFFLLIGFFNCEKRNFWLRKIKNATFRIPYNRRFDASCGTCGISNERYKKRFVINGTPVKPPYKYPWMVAVTKYGQQFCGGAIISNRFILTAAHCVKKYENKPRSVEIGFVTSSRELRPIVRISAIYCHPQYADDVFGLYDIALIKLRKRITCNKYKSPICLPQDNVILPPSTKLTIAGWGAYISGRLDEYPKDLLEGVIQTLSCEKCLFFDAQDCGRGLVYCMIGVHDQSSCFGDSGSPMFLSVGGRYYIEGVTSGGHAECELGTPFAFASVANSRSWIRNVAGI